MPEPADGPAAPDRCDFCQSPIPGEPVSLERGEADYRFCTEACREAMRTADRVFTAYRGHRRLDPGVAALSAKLPQGLLRNSFVLVAAQPGTRLPAVLAELVWRSLRRDEPALVVSFNEPPVAVVERFLGLGWNVLPALEDGRLRLLDCFTYRVEDRERMLSRMNDWSAHLSRVAEPGTTAVRDPTNLGELQSRLDDCLEAAGMRARGVVTIDSLTEFGAITQPVHTYDFVKDLRADVCKGRFVPVFAGGTDTGQADAFPHDLEYLFDGIVDLQLTPEIIEDALVKRARIRKMAGVLAYPEWTAYEYTPGDGMALFDPRAELQRTADGAAGGSPPDEGAGPPD